MDSPSDTTEYDTPHSLVLKRGTGPPLSPVRDPQSEPPMPCDQPKPTPREPADQVTPDYYSSTAALEFREFSLRRENGGLSTSHLTDNQQLGLQRYLKKTYGAVSFRYCLPFLILGCEEDPFGKDLPFTIAGAIAIWEDAKLPDDNFWPLIGVCGGGDPMKTDEEVFDMFAPLEIPSREALLYLAENVFTDCLALSMTWGYLVVELPQIPCPEHAERLVKLPESIALVPLNIEYYNGRLPNTPWQREMQPGLTRFGSTHIPELGEVYVIDSPETGRRNLFGYGRRIEFDRRSGKPKVGFDQGIYVTNFPITPRDRHGREVTSGEAIVTRCGDEDGGGGDALVQGEVIGTLHLADLQLYCQYSELENNLLYVGPYDPSFSIRRNGLIVRVF